jgi:hypothetical protein
MEEALSVLSVLLLYNEGRQFENLRKGELSPLEAVIKQRLVKCERALYRLQLQWHLVCICGGGLQLRVVTCRALRRL